MLTTGNGGKVALNVLGKQISVEKQVRRRKPPSREYLSRSTTMTAIWERRGHRGRRISLNYIGRFDARGMQRVYGRSDHFGRGRTFNMDVWLTRSGRLLVRFWARRDEVDWQSLEMIGFSHPGPPKNEKREMNEDWVPQCLRDEYDNWILSEL